MNSHKPVEELEFSQLPNWSYLQRHCSTPIWGEAMHYGVVHVDYARCQTSKNPAKAILKHRSAEIGHIIAWLRNYKYR